MLSCGQAWALRGEKLQGVAGDGPHVQGKPRQRERDQGEHPESAEIVPAESASLQPSPIPRKRSEVLDEQRESEHGAGCSGQRSRRGRGSGRQPVVRTGG